MKGRHSKLNRPDKKHVRKTQLPANLSHLCFHRDGSMALGTVVGTELGVAADAHRLALAADEPLPPKVLPTVETVRALCHRHSKGDTRLQQIEEEEKEGKILLIIKSSCRNHVKNYADFRAATNNYFLSSLVHKKSQKYSPYIDIKQKSLTFNKLEQADV